MFVFAVFAQLLASAAYALFLRPDPLLVSRELHLDAVQLTPREGTDPGLESAGRPGLVRLAILAVALSHATMVSLMAMTPVHLMHGGATLSVVGLTISLHIAGMFALSPVFGILSDRLGRIPTILIGQALLLGAAIVTALGSDDARDGHRGPDHARAGVERLHGRRLRTAQRRGAARPIGSVSRAAAT